MSDRVENGETPAVPPLAGRRSAARTRLVAVLICTGLAVIYGIAIYLTPAEEGHGTHRQLGLQPCGMLLVTGLPCPSCGMTTAFSHVVRGQLWRAFLAQPAGFLLAVGGLLVWGGAGWAAVTGRWPKVHIPLVTPFRLFLGLLVLLLGGWAIKLAIGLANGSLPAGA